MMVRKREGHKSVLPLASSGVSAMQEGIDLAEDLNVGQFLDERTLNGIVGTFPEKSGNHVSSKILLNDWRFGVVMQAKELSKQNTNLKTRLIKARSEASNLAEVLVAANDRMLDLTIESTRMKIHMRDAHPNITGPLKSSVYQEPNLGNLDWFPQQSKGRGLSVSNENLPQLTATDESSSQQKKRTHYLSSRRNQSKKRLTGDENYPSLKKRMASSVHQRSWNINEDDAQYVDMKTSNVDMKDLRVQLRHAENELCCSQASSEIRISKLKEEAKKLKEKLNDRKLDLKSAQRSEKNALAKANECSADASCISEILSAKEAEANALRLRVDEFDAQNKELAEEIESLRKDISIKRDGEDAMSNKLKIMETSLTTIREELRCERKSRKRNEDKRAYCEVLQLKLSEANERTAVLENELERTRMEMEKSTLKPTKQKQWNAEQRNASHGVHPQSLAVGNVPRSTTTTNTTILNGATILKDNNKNVTSLLGLATQSVAEKENRQGPAAVVGCVVKNEMLPRDDSSVQITASATATGNRGSSNLIVEKDAANRKCKLLSHTNLIDELQKEREMTQSLKNEISRLNETASEMVRLSELTALQSNLDAEKVQSQKMARKVSLLQSCLDKEKDRTVELTLSLNSEKARSEEMVMVYASMSEMEELKIALDDENACELATFSDEVRLSLNDDKKTVAHVNELLAFLSCVKTLRLSLNREKDNVKELSRDLDAEKERTSVLVEEVSELQSSRLESVSVLDMEALRSRLTEEKSRVCELLHSLALEKKEGERLRDELTSIQNSTALINVDQENLKCSLAEEKTHKKELMSALDSEKIRNIKLMDENSNLIAIAVATSKSLSGLEMLKSSFHEEQQCFSEEIMKVNETPRSLSAQELMMSKGGGLLEVNDDVINSRPAAVTVNTTTSTGTEMVSPTSTGMLPTAFNKLLLFHQPPPYSRNECDSHTFLDLQGLLIENRRLCKFGRHTVKCLQEAVQVSKSISASAANETFVKQPVIIPDGKLPHNAGGSSFSASTTETLTSILPRYNQSHQQQKKQVAVFGSTRNCHCNKDLETLSKEVSCLRNANAELKSVDLERIMRIESLSDEVSMITKKLKIESLHATQAEEALTNALNGPKLSGSKDENGPSSSSKIENFLASTNILQSADSPRKRCEQLESTNVKPRRDVIRETVGEDTLRRHHFAEKAKFATEIGILKDDLRIKSELASRLQLEVKLLTEKMKDVEIGRRDVTRGEVEQQVSCKLLDVESKLVTVEKRARKLEKKLGRKHGFIHHDEDILFKAEEQSLEGNNPAAPPVMKNDCNEYEEANNTAGKARGTTTAARIGISLANIESRNAELETEKHAMMRELAEMAEEVESTYHALKCCEESRASALMDQNNQVKRLENALTVKVDALQRLEATSSESKAREILLNETLEMRSAEVTCLQEKVIHMKSDASAVNNCLQEEIVSLKNELSLALKDSGKIQKMHKDTCKSLDEALRSKAKLDASICSINESIGMKLDEHKAMYQKKAMGLDTEYASMGVYLKNEIIALKALLEKHSQASSQQICRKCHEPFIVSEAGMATATVSVMSKWEEEQQRTAAALITEEQLEFMSEENEWLQMALEFSKSETDSNYTDMKWKIMDLEETQAYMSIEKKELILSVELLEYVLAEQSELLMSVVKDAKWWCSNSESGEGVGILPPLDVMVQEKEVEFLRNVLLDKEAEMKIALEKLTALETSEGFEEKSKQLELSVALLKQELEKRTEELERIQTWSSNAVSIAESTNGELKQENSFLKNEIDLLKDELDNNMAFMSAQLSSTLNEVKQLQQALDLKNDELDNDRSFLKGELVSKSDEVKMFQKKLEDSIAEATSERIFMKTQLHERDEALIGASKENEALITEIARLNVLVTKHSKWVNEVEPRLQEEIASLKQLLHNHLNCGCSHTGAAAQQRQEEEELENDDDISNHKEEMEALESDNENLRTINSDQKVEISSLQSTLKTQTSELETLKSGIVESEDRAALAQRVFEKKIDSQVDEICRMKRTFVFSKTEAGLNQKELEMKVSFLENALRLNLEKLEWTQQKRLNLNLNYFGGGGRAVQDCVGSLTCFVPKNMKRNDEVGFVYPCRDICGDDDEIIIGAGGVTTKAIFNNNVVPLDVVAIEDETTEQQPSQQPLNEERRITTHENDAVAGLNALIKEGCNTSLNHLTVSDFSFGLSSTTDEYSEIKFIEEESAALELPPPSSPLSNASLSISVSPPSGMNGNVQCDSSNSPSDGGSLFMHRRQLEYQQQRNSNAGKMEFSSTCSIINDEEHGQKQQSLVDGIANSISSSDCCNNNNNEIAAEEVTSCSGSPLDSFDLRLFEPEFVLESRKYVESELGGVDDSIMSYSLSSSSSCDCDNSRGGDDNVLDEQQKHWKDGAIRLSMTMSPASPHRRMVNNRPWRNKFRSLFRFWGLFSSTNPEDLSLNNSSPSSTASNISVDSDENSESSTSSSCPYSIRTKFNIERKKDDERRHDQSLHLEYDNAVGRMTPPQSQRDFTRFHSPSSSTAAHSEDEDEIINNPYSRIENIDRSARVLTTTTTNSIAPQLQEPRVKRRKSGCNIVQSPPDPVRSPSVCTTEAGDQSSAIIDIESIRPGWSAVLKQLKEIRLPDPVYYPYWELGF